MEARGLRRLALKAGLIEDEEECCEEERGEDKCCREEEEECCEEERCGEEWCREEEECDEGLAGLSPVPQAAFPSRASQASRALRRDVDTALCRKRTSNFSVEKFEARRNSSALRRLATRPSGALSLSATSSFDSASKRGSLGVGGTLRARLTPTALAALKSDFRSAFTATFVSTVTFT